jgi:putative membrane protein insertion efficiency factor
MLTIVFHKLGQILSWLLLGLIWCYQRTLSPLFGGQCRFHPTCSHYANEAIHQHGPVQGSLLAIWRICRCNPLCEGGLDAVPAKFSVKPFLQTSSTSSQHNGPQT